MTSNQEIVPTKNGKAQNASFQPFWAPSQSGKLIPTSENGKNHPMFGCQKPCDLIPGYVGYHLKSRFGSCPPIAYMAGSSPACLLLSENIPALQHPGGLGLLVRFWEIKGKRSHPVEDANSYAKEPDYKVPISCSCWSCSTCHNKQTWIQFCCNLTLIWLYYGASRMVAHGTKWWF